jgi:hypothetical protein
MGLQGFERRLERFVEGAFARVFRSGLQPIEIGRRLAREIDLRRAVAPRGVLAPNAFKVLLSSTDRARFEPIEEELVKELVQVAKDHANQEGYTLLGPVSVEIATDASLRPGTLLVAGDMVPEEGVASVTLPDGRRVLLEQETLVIGRLPECDLAVADPNVSRHHAELRRGADGSWEVVDLGSTNGTKVNGQRIGSPHQLQNGDEITLGSTTLQFDVSSAGRDAAAAASHRETRAGHPRATPGPGGPGAPPGLGVPGAT